MQKPTLSEAELAILALIKFRLEEAHKDFLVTLHFDFTPQPETVGNAIAAMTRKSVGHPMRYMPILDEVE